MAGQSKITQEMQDELIAAISDGLSRGRAAILVGTTLRSIQRLMKRNRVFRHRLKSAEVAFERVHLKRIAEGKPGWQASGWLMERKFWMRFAQVRREPPQPKEPDLPNNEPPGLA